MKTMVLARTVLALCAVCEISACATCERHPVVCTVAGAVVMGSVVLTLSHKGAGSNVGPQRARFEPPVCGPRDPGCKP